MAKGIIKKCCVCQKSEHEGKWDNHQHHAIQLITKQVEASHGFCPPCLDEYSIKNFGVPFAELPTQL